MSSQFRTISLVASSLLAGSLLFTGCGGGGGGGTSGGTTATSSVTLSGTAVDELIVNGVVTAHADSAAGSLLATGRTDNDGAYTLAVDNFDGVAVLKVECDAQSKLYYPATQRYEDCPANLRLFSAAPVTKNQKEVVINTTPATFAMFTLATGGNPDARLDSETVEEARNKIALALGGIDPVATDPVKNTTYKAVVEAFQEAAEENNTSTFDIIEKFAEDAADGVLGNENQEVVRLVAKKMAENNVTSPFVESVENNESYTPPQNPAGAGDIEQAKTFFDTLRTQGESLVGNNGFFETEARAIEAAIDRVTLDGDLAAKAIDNTIMALAEAIHDDADTHSETVVEVPDGNRTVTVTRQNATTWAYTFTDNRSGSVTTIASGTIVAPDINYSDTGVIDTFKTLQASFEGTIPATYFYEKTQSAQSFKADVTLTRTPEGADAAIDNIELSTADGTKIGISALKAAIGYDYDGSDPEDPVTPKYLKLQTVTLNGALDSSYSATGTLDIGYTQNGTLAQNGGITEVYTTVVDGHVGCPQGSNPDYVDYTDASFVVGIDGNTYTVTTDASGHFHQEIEGVEFEYDDFVNADINFTGTCSNGGEPTFDSLYIETDSDEKIGNSGYLPNRLAFSGTIRNEATGSELDGSVAVDLLNAAAMNLSDPDHVKEDPGLKVVLSGTLKRAQIDDTILNVTYQNSLDAANKINGHSFQTAYVYGATAVNMTGSFDKEMKNGNLAISSGNGLSITIRFKNGDIDYDNTTPLTKDGREIGRLDNETGVPRIKYIDGSFESLP